MPTDVSAHRVFIASPGGLDEERKAVRDELARFNEKLMHDLAFAFSPVGWEDLPGGVGRAQGLINERLRECDYTILLLGTRWGSPTAAVDGAFTSGTEEEYSVAIECVADSGAPMQDILVLFKGVPDEQLRDPGEQLKKVLEFKKGLEDSGAVFYKTFDDVESLRHEVALKLQAWASPTVGATPQVAKQAGTPQPEPTQGPPASALEAAEEFSARGQITQAEAAYASAIADGDIASLESYAKFLRRTGRLSKSLAVNQGLLSSLAKVGDPSTIEVRARVLANMGIVHRNLGDSRASLVALEEATGMLRTLGGSARSELAYSLDNLGVTLQRAGELEAALRAYQESLAIREETGDEEGQVASLTNLARLTQRQGNLDEAERTAKRALELLPESAKPQTKAAAYSALGELLEARGDLAAAREAISNALASNEASGNPDAVAMNLVQMARIALDLGEYDEAERLALRAREENDLSSNRAGSVSATHLLGRVFAATSRESAGIGLLEEAVSGYGAIGNANGEAWAAAHLVEAYLGAGDTEAARNVLDLANKRGIIARNSRLQELLSVMEIPAD